MFFSGRRKWNGKVAALLPTFDLTIEIVGPMAALEALDLVYHKGFSEQEGALYLAYLSYSTFVKDGSPFAANLKGRIAFAEDEWIRIGRANPKTIEAWRKKAEQWESDRKAKS